MADTEDVSPDRDERIEDFLMRHGGAGPRDMRRGSGESGLRGWSEVYAADGYTLRCDWSRVGGREEMSFSELPPGGPASGAPQPAATPAVGVATPGVATPGVATPGVATPGRSRSSG
jgi:hypothetical protein